MTTYHSAGVNIDAGNEFVKRLKALCPDIGGFSGLYPLGDQYLVAGTDGVGTKLKLAFQTGIHDTIGIDLVAMCVNDIITCGAKPLFFLDYFATSQLDIDQAESVMKGILKGCKEARCVLLGGETAEMPGFYHPHEYDLSGFAVGVVDKDRVIDGAKIKPGDVVLGIPSSGVHSNGYSLIRKILEKTKASEKLLSELMTPTRLYPKMIHQILEKTKILGMAHVTGGGITENLPRILPEGCGAAIDKRAWEIPSIFQWIQELGNVPEEEMYRTFNMGIGMILVVTEQEAEALDLMRLGTISEGEGVIWAS